MTVARENTISLRKFASMWVLQVMFTVLFMWFNLSEGAYMALTGIVWGAWLGDAIAQKFMERR